MAVGARVRPHGLGVGIMLGALAMWGCGSAEDVLYTWTGFRAGDAASGVPDGGMDVPWDQGKGQSDEGVDPGWDPGIDAGQDGVEDPGTDPGTDLRVDPGTDSGQDSGEDLGDDPGWGDPGQDPGVDAGIDAGGRVCPRDKDCTGRECDPDPVCGVSCGTCPGSWVCESGRCEWGPDDYTVQCSAGMCTVPGGSFWQGCNGVVDSEGDSYGMPYHEVNVPTYEIDQYEVTVDAYGACVSASACTSPGTYSSSCNWGKSGKGSHPVNCIDWYQAREYCSWAGKRMCSESEWEKASRGTDGRKYPWGNEPATCEYAVMDETVGFEGDGCRTRSTWPVGSKPAGASPYGVLDMSGNVWEWVEDDRHDSYMGAPTDGSAWVEDPREVDRVLHGGAFGDSIHNLRSCVRGFWIPGPNTTIYYQGVRCCRSIPPPD